MARSRHGRSRGGASPADSGLPSWAQRHLDEAGDPAPAANAALNTHRRSAASEPSRLRGWGVAIVSVAAAVGVVPLAITSLANDPSNDPLPKVDTYTAGAPAPLENGAGGTAGRRTGSGAAPLAPGSAGGDPASAGVLAAPPGAAPALAAPPVAAAPIVPARAVPAAVVRATPTVTPTTTTTETSTPRSATPTTTESTEQSRSATKPPASKPATPSKPSSKPQAPASKAPAAPSKKEPGLVGGVLDTGVKTVNGVARTATGLLGGG